MERPSLAVFTRLRRLADDGGRFMLVDLRGAEPALLADLVRGLAPFATAVVLDADPEQAVWRRLGPGHVGRIDGCRTVEEVARAEATAADAVLLEAVLTGAAPATALPRLGGDAAADLGLDRRGRFAALIVAADQPERLARSDAQGFLAPAAFWRDPLAGLADAAARRRCIADDLVPRLQAMNGAAADLPRAAWLDA